MSLLITNLSKSIHQWKIGMRSNQLSVKRLKLTTKPSQEVICATKLKSSLLILAWLTGGRGQVRTKSVDLTPTAESWSKEACPSETPKDEDRTCVDPCEEPSHDSWCHWKVPDIATLGHGLKKWKKISWWWSERKSSGSRNKRSKKKFTGVPTILSWEEMKRSQPNKTDRKTVASDFFYLSRTEKNWPNEEAGLKLAS
jgi:hypothetical protein